VLVASAAPAKQTVASQGEGGGYRHLRAVQRRPVGVRGASRRHCVPRRAGEAPDGSSARDRLDALAEGADLCVPRGDHRAWTIRTLRSLQHRDAAEATGAGRAPPSPRKPGSRSGRAFRSRRAGDHQWPRVPAPGDS